MGIGDGWLAKEGVKPDGNAVGGVNCSGCPSVFPGGVIYASSHEWCWRLLLCGLALRSCVYEVQFHIERLLPLVSSASSIS